jgi:hypothetical protein
MKNIVLLVLVFGSLFNLNAQNYKFGKVSKDEVESKVHPINIDANASVLFKKEEIYYIYDTNLGFVLYTDVHERIKIYNKDGFDWATKEIALYVSNNQEEEVVGVKGETYNIKNGELVSLKLDKDGVFEEKENKYRNKKKITMPGIREGSVIEYKYTIRSPFITSIDKIQLQYSIPIDKLEVNVIIPPFFIFKKHTNPQSQLDFKIQESKKRTYFTSSGVERNSGYIVRHSQNNSKIEYVHYRKRKYTGT